MGDWGVFVFDIIRFSGMSAGRVSDEKKHRKRNSFSRSGCVEIISVDTACVWEAI